ncbi:unnamed protein product [Prorocentrum cordatum]|uniref:HECT-type E3 ubiquitin transferase n=1 Tax=Prorocentrum cordatum TaxID=2364126 RepID=A0ABN9VW46_9DINO|nr:unnamed protein product [Polarella glacialis]
MINTNVDGPLAGTEAGNLLCDWFWDVMQRFGAERRAKLLQFATGSSRVPGDGFRGLEPPFCLYLCAGPAERLPTASTCSNQLNLAPYTSRSMLIDRLRVICSAEASLGFGFV